MFGNLISDELKKLGDHVMALTGLKHEMYLKVDALLVEGQNLSKEKLDAWFIEKRLELQGWANESPTVAVNPVTAPPVEC